jgi:glycosyltransferase involved in cell wall biosynthesis
MRYLFWEQFWVPRQCRGDRIDVFHTPFNYGMPWSTPCPRVLTLHDAIDHAGDARKGPRLAGWRPGALRSRWGHWVARRRAHHVITVSQHAREDIVHLLRIPAERLTVIYEAPAPEFTTPPSGERGDAVRAAYGLSRPYVFYVGGWETRKNVPFLLRGLAAAGLPEVDLVLAGGKEEERAGLLALAREVGAADQIRLLGFVPTPDLPALYGGALCFVYPSRYEGFGLQLVEAMAVGCPVLAARATCLPEILGLGGETFSLDGVEELAGLLRRVAADPSFRAELGARARRRARDFSWDRTAAETADVYRWLLRTRAGGPRVL